MNPRISVDVSTWDVQPKDGWAAAILAHQHRIDQEAAGERWTCKCRCCQWLREHNHD